MPPAGVACWSALYYLRKSYTTSQNALCYFRKPCAKTFGERCALQGLPEGVLSPNAAKLASLVTNVPCRSLCEGYFHQTFLNNCHKSTKGIQAVPDVTRRELKLRKLRAAKHVRKSFVPNISVIFVQFCNLRMLDCFTGMYSPMYLCDVKYSGMLYRTVRPFW